jgi:hypothetical protein
VYGAFVVCVQSYPLDNKTLLAIEVPVMALLEAKRYEGYKKTGEVRSRDTAVLLRWTATPSCWRVGVQLNMPNQPQPAGLGCNTQHLGTCTALAYNSNIQPHM